MFKLLLILILAFRISLFFLPSFQIDMNTWKAWSQRLVEVGPSNFYSQNFFSDYFPGYLYILWVAGSFFNLLSLSVNSFQYELFLKSITTLFDIGTTFFIYKIILKHNKPWAIFGSVFYLLNPALIFNTSVWGQVDGIFTFFIIYASYLLVEKKKIFEGSLATTLGILIKPQSLAMLPIIIIYNFQNFRKTLFFKSLFIVPIFILILSTPFFINNPIFGIFELSKKSQDVYQYTSLFAFNFWSLIGWWKPDSQSLVLTYKIWGFVLYTLSLALITIPFLKKKMSSKEFYLVAALSFLVFFLFLTRIHERYLFPFLPFILIAAMLRKSKLLIGVYLLSSIIHLVNLWYVYYYYNYVYGISSSAYNFVYLNSRFAENVIYIFISENFRLFSIANLALFAFLIFYNYKYAYKA